MTRRKTLAAALTAVALALGTAAGCGDDDDSGGTGVGEGGGNVGALSLGVLAPLTGDLAPFGGPGSQAADLAAAQVNAAAEASGVDLNLTLVTEDTGTDAQGAQEAATKLIESDGVAGIAGPWASSEVIPVAENVSVASGVPIVSPSGTDPAITELEDDGLVFRTAPSDAAQGAVLAEVVAAELGADSSLVTANRNDAYGNALVREFTAAWEAGGGTVSANVPYNPEAASLNSEASQIASGNPDGWVIIDFPETWAKMGPALVRTGSWDPARTFTADGLRSNSLPADTSRQATEGMRGSVPTSQGAPADGAFDALWDAEVGEPRQTYDAQNFDAVVLLALAAVAGGSSDPADIATNLPMVSGPEGTAYTFEQLGEAMTALGNGEQINYEGASGPIDFDDAGDPSAANYGTWSYTGGELVDTDEVIPLEPTE